MQTANIANNDDEVLVAADTFLEFFNDDDNIGVNLRKILGGPPLPTPYQWQISEVVLSGGAMVECHGHCRGVGCGDRVSPPNERGVCTPPQKLSGEWRLYCNL